MTTKPEPRKRLSDYMGAALIVLLLCGGNSEPLHFAVVLLIGLCVLGVIKALENLSDELQTQRLSRDLKAKK